MSRFLALALVAQLGACEEPPEPFPIAPGGGSGTGTGTQPDAAIDASDAGGMISGRVCVLLADVQTLGTCAATGVAGLAVALATTTGTVAMTTTADDGTFMLMRPADTTNLVWRVSGEGIMPSAQRFGTITVLPAIDSVAYDEMLSATGAILATGDGALMMRVTRAGIAVQNATVAAAPAPTSEIFYDGASQTMWTQTATGMYGVAWMPSVQVGTPELAITAGAIQTVIGGNPVFADTVTFVFAEIP